MIFFKFIVIFNDLEEDILHVQQYKKPGALQF